VCGEVEWARFCIMEKKRGGGGGGGGGVQFAAALLYNIQRDILSTCHTVMTGYLTNSKQQNAS